MMPIAEEGPIFGRNDFAYILKLLRAVVDLLVILSLVITVIGFKGWRSSLTVPPEDSLVLVEGRVRSVEETKGRKRRITGVDFRLFGHPEEWHYSTDQPNYGKAYFHLVHGGRVRLWALPKADRWRPRIWRLEITGTKIATFEMMKSYSRRQGRWGLALGIGGLVALAFFGWWNWQSSRASVIVKRWKRERRQRMRQLRERPLQAPK